MSRRFSAFLGDQQGDAEDGSESIGIQQGLECRFVQHGFVIKRVRRFRLGPLSVLPLSQVCGCFLATLLSSYIPEICTGGALACLRCPLLRVAVSGPAMEGCLSTWVPPGTLSRRGLALDTTTVNQVGWKRVTSLVFNHLCKYVCSSHLFQCSLLEVFRVLI